jgi:hypothetical protein
MYVVQLLLQYLVQYGYSSRCEDPKGVKPSPGAAPYRGEKRLASAEKLQYSRVARTVPCFCGVVF